MAVERGPARRLFVSCLVRHGLETCSCTFFFFIVTLLVLLPYTDVVISRFRRGERKSGRDSEKIGLPYAAFLITSLLVIRVLRHDDSLPVAVI